MFYDDVEHYPDPWGAEEEFYRRYQGAKAGRILDLIDDALELAEALSLGFMRNTCRTWVDTIRGVPSACVELRRDFVISLAFAACRDQGIAARRFMPRRTYVRYPAGVCRWTLCEKIKGTKTAFKEVMGGVSSLQEVLTVLHEVVTVIRAGCGRSVVTNYIRDQLTELALKDNQQPAISLRDK